MQRDFVWEYLPIRSLRSVQKGIGDTLGSLVVIIMLGAMLGKLVAASGAAKRITGVLMKAFGEKHIQWALMVTGFIVGIPLFYNVGFVLMVPLIFSVVLSIQITCRIHWPSHAGLPIGYTWVPSSTSFTLCIGWTVQCQYGTDPLTMVFIIAIPTIIVAGPIFARSLKNIQSAPLQTFSATGPQ